MSCRVIFHRMKADFGATVHLARAGCARAMQLSAEIDGVVFGNSKAAYWLRGMSSAPVRAATRSTRWGRHQDSMPLARRSTARGSAQLVVPTWTAVAPASGKLPRILAPYNAAHPRIEDAT
jgi:hypothetical protein